MAWYRKDKLTKNCGQEKKKKKQTEMTTTSTTVLVLLVLVVVVFKENISLLELGYHCGNAE